MIELDSKAKQLQERLNECQLIQDEYYEIIILMQEYGRLMMGENWDPSYAEEVLEDKDAQRLRLLLYKYSTDD